MRNRFGVLAALRVSDGEHVQRVIVVGILVAYESQVRDRLIVLAAVDRECRGKETLLDRLRCRLARFGGPLADVEIEPNALVQLLLFGIQPKNRFQLVDGGVIIVALDCGEAALVDCDRFKVRGPAWRAGGRRRWLNRRGGLGVRLSLRSV